LNRIHHTAVIGSGVEMGSGNVIARMPCCSGPAQARRRQLARPARRDRHARRNTWHRSRHGGRRAAGTVSRLATATSSANTRRFTKVASRRRGSVTIAF
jgi:hypothetical protein